MSDCNRPNTISKLTSEVSTTVGELSANGRAPATIVGAELNGQSIIAISGVPPVIIDPQLEEVISELG
ncbi:hypothetical protein SAMN05421786_11711 [Chryseobacterium ureilyticum]|uniref:Uncharacterized protein n=1 Tax=Chryseobacterium ureilyticum TaxID=373668 RepID=A0A1N7QT97_9FLAO|nr:hypothetical protein [Chryseobacterium ureilyticum]SIT26009.1 hypothetical protein SAMN05421786_11711 [Chryseobacterium ureilyticum]